MKKLFLFLTAISVSGFTQAQINVGGIIKDKVNQRAEQKVEEGVDKGLDETEKGVKDSTKKKDKDKKKSKEENKPEEKSENNNNSNGNNSNNNNSGNNNSNTSSTPQTQQADFKSYTKFDFVSGEQVVFYDDFSQDAVGDFPDKWHTTASGEVVTLNAHSGKWLKWVPNAYGNAYSPLLKNSFPDNFTLEFDIVATHTPDTDVPQFLVLIYSSQDKNLGSSNNEGVAGMYARFFEHWDVLNWSEKGDNATGKITPIPMDAQFGKKIHFSFWRQKQRLRIYINETKVLDLPRILPDDFQYNKINFLNTTPEGSGDIFLSNVRIAVGAPDMRNKLMTEGKLVTHGILFDVNSDKIKGESYGTLKEISQVLKDNAGVKVKIVGHTDSDGNAVSNLDLSKRRAASVKNSLSKDFGIDASRMETDGKGASEPASPNSSPEGKANNRRVEFIKM